jgi:hypothetical protein
MPALETAITNVYEPEISSQYFVEKTTEKSALIRSGIAAIDPDIEAAAAKGGRTIELPFFDDLPHDTDTSDRSKVVTDTDDEITPDGITTDYDVAVKMFRAQSWRTANVVKYVAGADPAKVFMDRYVNWWLREDQRLLLKILSGVFSDATIAAALSNDISGEVATTDAGRLISTDAILDTQFLLGDAYDLFTAIAVHSTVYKRMKKLDMIDTIPDSQQAGKVINKFGNLDVIVDDKMTATAGSTSGYKYSTYLFGRGAIAFSQIPLTGGDQNVVVWRDEKKGVGAGSTEVITRRNFIMHPRGIKYTGSLAGVTGPSDADLAADNWTQVYQTKNIRIARLITNG